MMHESFWISTAPILAVLGPLVGIPLTVITFYLRSLREQQVAWHAELMRRFESLERSTLELRRHVDEFERDYATKEEWLRECLHARRVMENLTETTVRLDATMAGVLATLQGADRRRGPNCQARRDDREPPTPVGPDAPVANRPKKAKTDSRIPPVKRGESARPGKMEEFDQ
jgi:hypothetical protein